MLKLSWIYWDPKPEIFKLPVVNFPVLWYGALFAFGFAIGFSIFIGILVRFFGKDQKKKAVEIADRLTVYMIVATVVGARLGHFLFYERPSSYLKDPLEIFRVWEGGLASHGAVIGIVLGVILFSIRIRPVAKQLDWIRLLDFIAAPAAFAGFCIRVGNFINQEVLGKITDVPWAVVFGHPLDRSAPAPRHPVQLYEAFFYLAVFFILWRLSFYPENLKKRGKLAGLFLILVFGFRFFIEYLKVEQSHLLDASLTMGQILSIPAVIMGFYFYFRKRSKS
jgi:phosphatidylglycerol:prolipoprotein diacylglycerol transferase